MLKEKLSLARTYYMPIFPFKISVGTDMPLDGADGTTTHHGNEIIINFKHRLPNAQTIAHECAHAVYAIEEEIKDEFSEETFCYVLDHLVYHVKEMVKEMRAERNGGKK